MYDFIHPAVAEWGGGVITFVLFVGITAGLLTRMLEGRKGG